MSIYASLDKAERLLAGGNYNRSLLEKLEEYTSLGKFYSLNSRDFKISLDLVNFVSDSWEDRGFFNSESFFSVNDLEIVVKSSLGKSLSELNKRVTDDLKRGLRDVIERDVSKSLGGRKVNVDVKIVTPKGEETSFILGEEDVGGLDYTNTLSIDNPLINVIVVTKIDAEELNDTEIIKPNYKVPDGLFDDMSNLITILSDSVEFDQAVWWLINGIERGENLTYVKEVDKKTGKTYGYFDRSSEYYKYNKGKKVEL